MFTHLCQCVDLGERPRSIVATTKSIPSYVCRALGNTCLIAKEACIFFSFYGSWLHYPGIRCSLITNKFCITALRAVRDGFVSNGCLYLRSNCPESGVDGADG